MTAIHLASEGDAAACLSLMARNHTEQGLGFDDDHRTAIVAPLLAGSPLGAVWLIGPQRAPLGYVLVTFDWSLEFGGMVAWIKDIYIRASVRNRGIGTEVIHGVGVSLRDAGVKALLADAPADNPTKARFAKTAGFGPGPTLTVVQDVL